MPRGAFATKTKAEILRTALQKLQTNTNVTSVGPGSVARALAESVVNELGDFYAAMDFNTSMGLITSAQGRALDLLGELFAVERKEIGELATIDASIGAFYFFVDEPYNGGDIVIPASTIVSTDAENFIGDSYTYTTVSQAVIPQGRTRVFVSIRPQFLDSVFTAGKNTIVRHNVSNIPEGVILRCTNPKAVAAQPGLESDANFRVRIMQAVRTAAGGTTDAIRFAGLAVEGVRDVRMRPKIYGLGSVEALVVPEERKLASVVIPAISREMDKVKPAGVRLIIREPDYISCDIHGSIVVRKDISLDHRGVSQRAQTAILRYLNTLLPGDTLIYSRLIQATMEASDAIKDVAFTRLRINDREVLRGNFSPESDQQIVPGTININAS